MGDAAPLLEVGRIAKAHGLRGEDIPLFELASFILMPLAFGSLIGVASAYFGGRVDMLVQRGVYAWMSFPPLLLLMMLLTNSRRVVGARTNSRSTNFLGVVTTVVTFLFLVGFAVQQGVLREIDRGRLPFRRWRWELWRPRWSPHCPTWPQ